MCLLSLKSIVISPHNMAMRLLSFKSTVISPHATPITWEEVLSSFLPDQGALDEHASGNNGAHGALFTKGKDKGSDLKPKHKSGTFYIRIY